MKYVIFLLPAIQIPSQMDTLRYNLFTSLNIYNGKPSCVQQDVKGQQLPINQLKGKQPMVVCPISNVHRCKRLFKIYYQ